MDSLPNDVCWSIFKQFAFKEGEEDMYPILCEIGKSIIEKCGSIPLVIKVLAILLKSQRDAHKWLQISEMDVFGSMAVFKLSYCELSSHLKPCFASMSLMKDTDLSTDHVPYIWSALGLLPTEDKHKDIEGLGYSNFIELASKSLIEKPSIHFDGIYLKCEMHDLLLDLAVRHSMGEALAINVISDSVNYGIIGESARHIVWKVKSGHNFEDIKSQKEPLEAIKARTLRFNLEMNQHNCEELDLEKGEGLPGLESLRYLFINNLKLASLPNGVKSAAISAG
uniref:Disease resistance protein winged helix domain-containing protein n=1 Tax=Chenopodium quinoa TaxID=63459 RepID=A0A803MM21_CHEQI